MASLDSLPGEPSVEEELNDLTQQELVATVVVGLSVAVTKLGATVVENWQDVVTEYMGATLKRHEVHACAFIDV